MFIEHTTEAFGVLAGGFLFQLMGRMVRETTQEVAAEREEEESAVEALFTKKKSLSQEPVVEPTPGEEIIRKRHVASEVLAPEMIAPGEEIIAEEDIFLLKPTFTEVAPGPMLIAEVHAPIT